MGSVYFAQPWFWVGAFSLAIPFLLLLTKAQKRHVTDFSSIQFLRTITEKASNRIQWKRLLLLATRLLMLLSLVIAFMLPFFNQRAGWFGEAKNHLIFILDNSYSMGYEEEGISLFELAKQKAAEIARQPSKGAKSFSLYVFNTKLERKAVKMTDQNSFLSEIRKQKVSFETTSFADIFAELKGKVSIVPEMKTKVFVLSDFSTHETQLQDQLEKRAQTWCPSCQIELLVIRPKDFKNFYFKTILLPPHFFIPGVEEEIKAVYQAEGFEGKEIQVSLKVQDAEIEKKVVPIAPDRKGTVTFKYKFPAPGLYPITISAQSDGLPMDNQRFEIVQVHEPLRILLVEAKSYEYPFDSPYFYFTQVLENDKEKHRAKSWIELSKIPAAQLGDTKLHTYDLVVLADVAQFDARQLTQLRYYFKEGGTLLFALGENFEAKVTTNAYFQQLLGGQWGSLAKSLGGSPSFFLEKVRYEHPLFQVFEKGRKGDLKTIAFSKYRTFIPDEKTDYEMLLSFAGEHPALLEMKKDQGRLLLWTSSLNSQWTDFPKDPLYVPFIFELMKYSVRRFEEPYQMLETGERIKFKGNDAIKPIKVKNPQAQEIVIYPNKNGKLQGFLADQPGFYEWIDYQKETPAKAWAVVNVSPFESKANYLKMNEMKKNNLKGAFLNPQSGLASKVFFYRPFVYLVMFFLLLEAWLANQFYKPTWV